MLRSVAMKETLIPLAQCPRETLAAVEGAERLAAWLPYQAARAGLLAQAGRPAEGADALRLALALDPAPAERLFLARRLSQLGA